MDMNQFSRVIAISNGKGGVLKTTLATNMAGLLAQSGQQVLLIDLDPQANTAIDLGYAKNENIPHDGKMLAAALEDGDTPTPIKNIRPGLDVLPSGEKLRRSARELSANPNLAKTMLAKALTPIINDYDIVLIDCPPGDQALLMAAMSIARWVIVPLRSDITSIDGLNGVVDSMNRTADVNPLCDILAVVFTSSTAGASNVARKARRNIEAAIGQDKAAEVLLESSIRHSDATAQTARDRGKLFHELEADAGNATPFWEILRGNISREDAQYIPQAATNVAADMYNVTNELINKLLAKEAAAAGEGN